MLSGFGHAVLLIELAEQFLKECSHGVIVNTGETLVAVIVKHGVDSEVDIVVGKFLNQAAQSPCIAQVIHLLFELELLDDVLHVAAEAVEVFEEVLLQTDGVRLATERLHCEARRVAERIVCYTEQHLFLRLLGNRTRVELLLLFEHILMGGFKQDVEAAKHHHGQDYFLVIALVESVHQNIVGDVPNESE